jgi:Flp pilus assembly protein TadG
VVVEAVEAVEVVEVVVVVEVEVDAMEKGQRIGAVRTAARTTIRRKTVGSARKSKTNNSNHTNVFEMMLTMMSQSATNAENPVTCVRNAL